MLVLAGLPCAPGAGEAQGLDETIRNRIEAGRVTGEFHVEGSRILAMGALPRFYLERDFAPVWVSPAGSPVPRADSLLVLLAEAPSHGLDGNDYHLRSLQQLRNELRRPSATPGDRVDFELLATDAFLVFGSHLLLGRVDPARVEAEWLANRRDADMTAVLRDALAGGNLRGTVEDLAPGQPEYARLQRALAELRPVVNAGGWGTIDGGPTLREGERSPRIRQLRHRLARSTEPMERELAQAPDSLTELFTPELARAVVDFQERHGLEADGAVGERTLAALNVSADVRVRQLQANLERWRWLPAELGRRHIRVNIAAFETEVWEAGSVALRLRSIVGRQYRMTPSFTASMRYLVLAPYWHVPPTIAEQDKFPEIRRNPDYIRNQRFTLLDQRTNQAVDPGSVDWSALTGRTFNQRYRLRQDPGPTNALGDVKFMFPNPHHVYLHDTPSRELFRRSQRDFSSGCIRVENPLALAEYLLGADPSWTRDRIRSTIAGGVERTVHLDQPVPVHLLYLTAFVDDRGRVNFRPDLYSRDTVVLGALAADPPAP